MLPIDAEIVDRARRLLDEHAGLGARDALHAAVVSVNSLDGICSFDRGFDGAGVRRVEPGALVER